MAEDAGKRLLSLQVLYEKVHSCRACQSASGCMIREDLRKVVRTTIPWSIESELFIIGQALGEHTQRLSGIPYTNERGALSSTARSLNNWLSLLSYTIDSADSTSRYKYAYSSDIVQCFPGKYPTGKGDRAPTPQEIRNCVSRGFLIREIELVTPKLVVLMGKTSRDGFYKYVLEEKYPDSLSAHIDEVKAQHDLQYYNVGNARFRVIAIQHPSGSNRLFSSMKNDKPLIKLIRGALND